MLSLSARAACSYTRSSCTVHTVLVLQFYSLRLSCHTIIGPPQKRSPQTVHGRIIIGVSLTGKEGLISSQLEQPSWTTLPVCTPPSARHRSCIYVVGPSIARVASFPGRFSVNSLNWRKLPETAWERGYSKGDQVWLRYLVRGDRLFCRGQSGGTAFQGGLSTV